MANLDGHQRGRSFQKEGEGARKFRKSQKGTSLVEFALVLPLLLILTFGMIEFAIMMYDQQVITNAAREGARRGIVQVNPRVQVNEIEDTVHNFADAHLFTFLAEPGPPSIAVTCDGVEGAVCNAFGQDLAVTVRYNFHYLVIGNLVPGLGAGVELVSTASMRCE